MGVLAGALSSVVALTSGVALAQRTGGSAGSLRPPPRELPPASVGESAAAVPRASSVPVAPTPTVTRPLERTSSQVRRPPEQVPAAPSVRRAASSKGAPLDFGAYLVGAALAIALLAWLIASLVRRPARGLGFAPPEDLDDPPVPPRPATRHATVVRISVGYDWTSRRAVQSALRELGPRFEAADGITVHQLARRVIRVMAGAVGKRYVVVERATLAVDAAREDFQRRALALRSRFEVETVRNDASVAAPPATTRVEEGDGMLVASVLVLRASEAEALPARPVDSDVQLRAILDECVPIRSAHLGGFELVWSPTDDADRMSSAELEVLYPELRRLDRDPRLGRLSCPSCRAVFAGELGRCPVCGDDRAAMVG